MLIYVKLTNKCNLACKHCYNSVCDTKVDMSDEYLEKVIEIIENRWKSLPMGEHLDVALHGGEPTLFDLKKLRYLCGEIIACGATVSATTNLMYEITTEHLKLFNMLVREDGTRLIVTSWDGGNVRFKDEKAYETWFWNVRYLLGQHFEVQPIITLTKPVLEMTPKEIYDKMREVGVSKLNFERLTHTGRAEINKDLWVSNRDVDKWLGEAYKLNEMEYKFDIPLFKELELAHEGIKTGCKARMCSLKVLTINPDGTIACCPNDPLACVAHLDRWKYEERTPEEHETHKKLIMRESRRSSECLACEYYTECNGECFQLRWDETGCPGMIETIKNIRLNYNGELF